MTLSLMMIKQKWMKKKVQGKIICFFNTPVTLILMLPRIQEELGEFENSIEKLLSTPLACKSEPAVETALEEARPRLKSEAQKDH